MSYEQTDAQKKFDPIFEELAKFFQETWKSVMVKKFGIYEGAPGDNELINEFLKFLEDEKLDFTNSFRELPEKLESGEGLYLKIKKRLEDQGESLEKAIELMNSVNPYIIPRNHLVERAIQLANQEDYTFFKEMVEAFKEPYEQKSQYKELTLPPKPDEIVYQTFCGT